MVPRWSSGTLRLSPLVIKLIWPLWRYIGVHFKAPEHREDFLGTFAPLTVMLILLAWVLSLTFGYGLMLHALRAQILTQPESIGTAFYLAGTSLLTIGFGDIVGVGGLARFVLLTAAASGLAVMALVISLTFSLYGSFQRREVLVLTLDARAGAPPSGVNFLETYAQLGMLDQLPDTFRAWEVWSAEMLESHLAYPILPYFRSSHDNESWVSAMGAVLDAATLLLTTVDVGNSAPRGAAQMMYGLGCHAVVDLSHALHLPIDHEPGVERTEYEQARQRLARAGFALKDAEESWRAFAKMRSAYAMPLNGLARHFATPPTQWIGDRSNVSYLHAHAQRGQSHELLAGPNDISQER